ncbi:MAG: VCBS repeat-containing protein, partial [Armatimonadota bacterium]|nr:VCBS repeat-containing protein [Armatimonadota bacterium]
MSNFSITRRQLLLGLFGLSTVGLSHCKPKEPGLSPVGPGPDAHSGFFRDVTAEAGLRFKQGHGGTLHLNILDTIGSGCAFVDYDGDGWLDILLIGQPSCALYQNGRNGTFKDVTKAAGLGAQGHWTGCAVGDFNNDGHPDLYISGYNCGALYLNDSSGRFKDVTHAYGIKPERWETSCCFFDADGDGRLDLYVARYVNFGPQSQQFCTRSGLTTACGPLVYKPDRGTLYLNKGGKFEDATPASGLGRQAGNGL